MYVIVVKGYILNIKFVLYQNHILKNFPYELMNENFQKDVIICKSCKRKFDIGKPFDLVLQNHITTNKPNMKFLLMLNRIKERIIAPCLTFAQIFQLQGYEQYGLRGEIVNVPTYLNIIQIFLP
jgi:hypothetical protein